MLAMDGGEHFFESIANSFMSKNADVEQFFRKKAVQATKLNTAATYLVISYCILFYNRKIKTTFGFLFTTYCPKI